jgi:hypothetical protein
VVDLDTDLIAPDPDIAFEKIPEINRIDHLAHEQIALAGIVRRLQMSSGRLQPRLKMLELERPLEERTMEAQKNRDSVPCSASPAGVCESMF